MSFSVRRLRNWILVALVIGVGAYTLAMHSLTSGLARSFGPQVRVDLEWRAQRGAQELARACDVGLAVADADIVSKCFGAYAESDDVMAIVAADADSQTVKAYGKPPESSASLFAGEPGALREGHGYLVSWAPSVIENTPVGKVALVVSTRRLHEANALLQRSSDTTLVAGLLALLLGVLVVSFFTRAVALRDTQLSDYAVNLERKVEERTQELDARNRGMRLVLDNVAQGFLTIGLDGQMASERSAVVDQWFGSPAPNATLMAYLEDKAPEFVQWLNIGLEQLREGLMPAQLLLDQMPKQFTVGARSYEVTYTPIGPVERFEQLLVIISDVTEALARSRSEREQRELVRLFQRISVDRVGVEDFLAEAASLVAALRREKDPPTQKRLVHTLKGNCAIYGLESCAELAHHVEDELAESGTPLSDEQRDALVGVWKQAMQRVGWLLGDSQRDVIDVERGALQQLINRMRGNEPYPALLATLSDWQREPVAMAFERLGRQTTALAARLGKPEPKIVIDDGGVRIAPKLWSPYWSAMVHVVRNAVDHGIESAETRALHGKPERPTVIFTARRHDGVLTFSVADDGGGIDWEKVRSKAQQAGLPSSTAKDLADALFHDGLSTRETASATSGRGVGLGTLQAQVFALHGEIEVSSTESIGTTFRFRFEEKRAEEAARQAPTQNNLGSLLPKTG